MNKIQLKKLGLKPLPKFSSPLEESEFYDTHELTEFFDFKHPKKMRFVLGGKKMEQSLTIRLQPELVKQIKRSANNLGLSVSSLARMWFIEKLESVSLR